MNVNVMMLALLAAAMFLLLQIQMMLFLQMKMLISAFVVASDAVAGAVLLYHHPFPLPR